MRWLAKLLVASTLVVASSGCRGCAEERGAPTGAAVSGPTMPTGMLVPVPGGDSGTGTGTDTDTGAAAAAGAMMVARGVKGGAWAELQVAQAGDTAARTNFQHWRDDSRFVSLEAMTAMHEPFARALPGFDLFLPRLFSLDALLRLSVELDAFAQRSSGELATSARELAAIAKDARAKGESLWVLGP
jgi:hypothetical protein